MGEGAVGCSKVTLGNRHDGRDDVYIGEGGRNILIVDFVVLLSRKCCLQSLQQKFYPLASVAGRGVGALRLGMGSLSGTVDSVNDLRLGMR